MMSVTTLLGCRRQNPRAWQYSTCSSTALATTEARARPRRTAVALTTGAGDVITAVAMAEGRYSAVVGALLYLSDLPGGRHARLAGWQGGDSSA